MKAKHRVMGRLEKIIKIIQSIKVHLRCCHINSPELLPEVPA